MLQPILPASAARTDSQELFGANAPAVHTSLIRPVLQNFEAEAPWHITRERAHDLKAHAAATGSSSSSTSSASSASSSFAAASSSTAAAAASLLGSHLSSPATTRLRLLKRRNDERHVTRFVEILDSLQRFAAHSLAFIFEALARWRAQQQDECSLAVAQLRGQASPSSSSSSQASPGPGASDVSQHRVTLFQEAYTTAIDLVFARVCAEVLQHFNGHNLAESHCHYLVHAALSFYEQKEIRLETSWLKSLLASSAPNTTVYRQKREALGNMWAVAIGCISKHKSLVITRDFFSQVHVSSSPAAAERMLLGLKHLQLCVTDADGLATSMAIVQRLATMLKYKPTSKVLQSKREKAQKDRKYAVAPCLASILNKVADQDRHPDLDYSHWYSLLDDVFRITLDWAQKRKRWIAGAPLLTATLCCFDEENFLAHFGEVIEYLTRAFCAGGDADADQGATASSDGVCSTAASCITGKGDAPPSAEERTRMVALMCVQRLFEVYLGRHGEKKETTHRNLDFITHHLVLPSIPDVAPQANEHMSSLLGMSLAESSEASIAARSRLPASARASSANADSESRFRPPPLSVVPDVIQDGLVALVLTVAQHSETLPFATERMILRLLSDVNDAGSSRTAISPHVLVGLRALSTLLQRPQSDVLHKTVPETSHRRSNYRDLAPWRRVCHVLSCQPPHPNVHQGAKVCRSGAGAGGVNVPEQRSDYRSLAQLEHSLLEPSVDYVLETLNERVCGQDLEPICQHRLDFAGVISRILQRCFDAVGGYTVVNAPPHALDDQELLVVAAYRLVLTCLPIICPDDIPKVDLLNMLCMASVHIDDGVRNAAFYVLDYFMRQEASLRAGVINQMVRFIANLPEDRSNVTINCLIQLDRLMVLWIEELRKNKDMLPLHDSAAEADSSLAEDWQTHTYDDLDVEEIEAVALLGLCQSSTVREHFLHLIESVRALDLAVDTWREAVDALRRRAEADRARLKQEQQDAAAARQRANGRSVPKPKKPKLPPRPGRKEAASSSPAKDDRNESESRVYIFDVLVDVQQQILRSKAACLEQSSGYATVFESVDGDGDGGGLSDVNQHGVHTRFFFPLTGGGVGGTHPADWHLRRSHYRTRLSVFRGELRAASASYERRARLLTSGSTAAAGGLASIHLSRTRRSLFAASGGAAGHGLENMMGGDSSQDAAPFGAASDEQVRFARKMESFEREFELSEELPAPGAGDAKSGVDAWLLAEESKRWYDCADYSTFVEAGESERAHSAVTSHYAYHHVRTELPHLQKLSRAATATEQETWTMVLGQIFRQAQTRLQLRSRALLRVFRAASSRIEPLLLKVVAATQVDDPQGSSSGASGDGSNNSTPSSSGQSTSFASRLARFSPFCRTPRDQWASLRHFLHPEVLSAQTNYALAAAVCASSHCPEVSGGANDSAADMLEQQLAAELELYDGLLCLLDVELLPLRRLAVTALGHVHPQAATSVFARAEHRIRVLGGFLQAYAAASSSKQKKQRMRRSHGESPEQLDLTTLACSKAQRMRLDVSHIYRLVAEGVTGEVLRDNTELRTALLSFVEDTRTFLDSPDCRTHWPLHELRLNFCLIVQTLAEEWSTPQQVNGPSEWKSSPQQQSIMHLPDSNEMDKVLRRELFEFLMPWCRHGLRTPANIEHAQQMQESQLDLLDRYCSSHSSSGSHSAGSSDDEEACDSTSSRAVLAKMFRTQSAVLQFHSLQAMAALLHGVCFDDRLLRDVALAAHYYDLHTYGAFAMRASAGTEGVLFGWLSAILRSSMSIVRSVAYKAVENFVTSNPAVLHEVVNCCYASAALASEEDVARRYFLILGEIFQRQELALSPCVWLHLAVYALGDTSPISRQMAVHLVPLLEERYAHLIEHGDEPVPAFDVLLASELYDTSFDLQLHVSTRFATLFSSVANEFIFEAVHRCYMLSALPDRQRRILAYLRPWMAYIRLGLHDSCLDDPAVVMHAHDTHAVKVSSRYESAYTPVDGVYGPQLDEASDAIPSVSAYVPAPDPLLGDTSFVRPPPFNPAAMTFPEPSAPPLQMSDDTAPSAPPPAVPLSRSKSIFSSLSMSDIKRSASLCGVPLPSSLSALSAASASSFILDEVPSKVGSSMYPDLSRPPTMSFGGRADLPTPRRGGSLREIDESWSESEVEAKQTRFTFSASSVRRAPPPPVSVSEPVELDSAAVHIHMKLLNALMSLTIEFGSQFHAEVRAIWEEIAAAPTRIWSASEDGQLRPHELDNLVLFNNVAMVVNYILDGMTSPQSGWDGVHTAPLRSAFFDAARRVCMYMASRASKDAVSKLLAEIRRRGLGALDMMDEMVRQPSGGMSRPQSAPVDMKQKKGKKGKRGKKKKKKSKKGKKKHMVRPTRAQLIHEAAQLELLLSRAQLVNGPRLEPGVEEMRERVQSAAAAASGTSVVDHAQRLTASNYALMLLVEVIYETNFVSKAEDEDSVDVEDVAGVLHIAVLGMAHSSNDVRRACRRMLVHIVHTVAFKHPAYVHKSALSVLSTPRVLAAEQQLRSLAASFIDIIRLEQKGLAAALRVLAQRCVDMSSQEKAGGDKARPYSLSTSDSTLLQLHLFRQGHAASSGTRPGDADGHVRPLINVLLAVLKAAERVDRLVTTEIEKAQAKDKRSRKPKYLPRVLPRSRQNFGTLPSQNPAYFGGCGEPSPLVRATSVAAMTASPVVTSLFSVDQLQTLWAREALGWANRSVSVLWASRSHQVYRALCVEPRVEDFDLILETLWRVSGLNEELQRQHSEQRQREQQLGGREPPPLPPRPDFRNVNLSVLREVLRTLRAMTKRLLSSEWKVERGDAVSWQQDVLVDIIWAAVTQLWLKSPAYVECVLLLELALDVDFGSSQAQHARQSRSGFQKQVLARGREILPGFSGVQRLVFDSLPRLDLQGLLVSGGFISTLVPLASTVPELVDPRPNAFELSLAVLIPWLGFYADPMQPRPEQLVKAVADLFELAQARQLSEMAKVLYEFSERREHTGAQFVKRLTEAVCCALPSAAVVPMALIAMRMLPVPEHYQVSNSSSSAQLEEPGWLTSFMLDRHSRVSYAERVAAARVDEVGYRGVQQPLLSSDLRATQPTDPEWLLYQWHRYTLAMLHTLVSTVHWDRTFLTGGAERKSLSPLFARLAQLSHSPLRAQVMEILEVCLQRSMVERPEDAPAQAGCADAAQTTRGTQYMNVDKVHPQYVKAPVDVSDDMTMLYARQTPMKKEKEKTHVRRRSRSVSPPKLPPRSSIGSKTTTRRMTHREQKPKPPQPRSRLKTQNLPGAPRWRDFSPAARRGREDAGVEPEQMRTLASELQRKREEEQKRKRREERKKDGQRKEAERKREVQRKREAERKRKQREWRLKKEEEERKRREKEEKERRKKKKRKDSRRRWEEEQSSSCSSSESDSGDDTDVDPNAQMPAALSTSERLAVLQRLQNMVTHHHQQEASPYASENNASGMNSPSHGVRRMAPSHPYQQQSVSVPTAVPVASAPPMSVNVYLNGTGGQSVAASAVAAPAVEQATTPPAAGTKRRRKPRRRVRRARNARNRFVSNLLDDEEDDDGDEFGNFVSGSDTGVSVMGGD